MPEEGAARADDPGDQGAFAVVAPAELTRPIPVLGLVAREVDRAVVRQVAEMRAERGRDERGENQPASGRRQPGEKPGRRISHGERRRETEADAGAAATWPA